MLTIEASADEIRATLELVQRAPLTRAEALFIEALFTRWLAVVQAASAPPAIQPSDQHTQPLPAGVPSTNGYDQVQSTQNR